MITLPWRMKCKRVKDKEMISDLEQILEEKTKQREAMQMTLNNLLKLKLGEPHNAGDT